MENYDELIRLVTEQVVAVLEGRENPEGAAKEGWEKLLVIGDPELLSEEMRKDRVVCTIEDYKQHKNILRYSFVAITKLTLTELADIALGRDAAPNQCAVIQALLRGVDVYLFEDGLPYSPYAGRGSGMFYAMLDRYTKALRTFGIKPVKRGLKEIPIPVKPPRFKAPRIEVPAGHAQPNSSRLITEDIAKSMVSAGGKVVIPANAIVTPAAWDIFRQSLAEVEKES